jgi:hypothetical protein
MNKLILCAIAAFVLGGCATAESSNGTASSTKAAKEDYVTGSRIPRTDSSENYQGAKSMTGRDYQDYKASTGLTSH